MNKKIAYLRYLYIFVKIAPWGYLLFCMWVMSFEHNRAFIRSLSYTEVAVRSIVLGLILGGIIAPGYRWLLKTIRNELRNYVNTYY